MSREDQQYYRSLEQNEQQQKQIVNRYKSNSFLSLLETNLCDTQADRFVTSQSIKRNFFTFRTSTSQSKTDSYDCTFMHVYIIHRRKTKGIDR